MANHTGLQEAVRGVCVASYDPLPMKCPTAAYHALPHAGFSTILLPQLCLGFTEHFDA